LNNPRPALIEMDNPKNVIERRLEIISSVFESNISRLAAWAFVDCILSACWWIESGGQTCNFSLKCAEIFDHFCDR
jgi:streptomycin 6-kinase